MSKWIQQAPWYDMQILVTCVICMFFCRFLLILKRMGYSRWQGHSLNKIGYPLELHISLSVSAVFRLAFLHGSQLIRSLAGQQYIWIHPSVFRQKCTLWILTSLGNRKMIRYTFISNAFIYFEALFVTIFGNQESRINSFVM